MIRRTRTTKTLAKRIDLQYFTQATPFRRWRLVLSIALPVLALAWILGQHATAHPQRPYSSGPLSPAHAVFTSQCNLCHVQQAGSFRQDVQDKACLGCHDAPLHTVKQSFTPECGSCHAEHKGSFRLARTSDSACTQCHADLSGHLRAGPAQVIGNVNGFDRAHPEFAPLRRGGGDPGQVKLNHYAHLRPGLAGPHGPVQMQCSDCHRAANPAAVWPYGVAPQLKAAGASASPLHAPVRGASDRAYMLPIRYVDQCAGCHTRDLQFDKRFSDAVPHDKPQVVHDFLLEKYRQYIAAHPGALREPQPLMYPVPARNPREVQPLPRNSAEWVTYQVAGAERLLWNKGCKLCHSLEAGGAALPVIAKSNIPARWLPRSRFDHDAHRMMACDSCHAAARNSRDTANVLIPAIATCRQCHKQQGARVEAAEGRCFECHDYHKWVDEKPVKGKYNIPQLRAATPLPSRTFPGEAVPAD
jgi:predicted CXXCH cytochrome family protein